MSDQYLGEIRMVGFNFAPVGWALCNGQTLSISQNTALFSLLGTTYGGNGTSTFQLPNLQSRFPLHQGTGVGLPTYVIGQSAGSPNTTLLSTNLPAHTHPLNITNAAGTQSDPTGALIAQINSGGKPPVLNTLEFATGSTTGSMAATAIGPNAGGSVPISIQPAYLTVNFVIALVGIFPSRN
jgi:microcystin-dependent protein